MIGLAAATTLGVRGGTGYCYFVLFALSLGAAFTSRYRLAPRRLFGQFPLYAAAMLSFAVLLPAQQAIEGYYLPREFDGMSRFALSLLIFLLLAQAPLRTLKSLGWGSALGAITAGGWGLYSFLQPDWVEASRLGNDFTNAIPFGNTALLLAFISVMSIRWDMVELAAGRRTARAVAVAFKLIGGASGVYASYLSGTRGGWVAIPLFIVLFSLNMGWIRHPRHWLAGAGVIVIAMGALLVTPNGQERLAATRSDLARLSHGSAADSSLGARLELWGASVRLFEDHPLLGVGKGHLERSLQGLANAGEISPEVVNQRAHSEFFSTIAELGGAGVLCLALMYLGPLVYFVRYRRSPNPDVRTAAYCGIGVSGSVIIFGLSIDVFTVVMSTSLIALVWAVLFAMLAHEPLQAAAQSDGPAPGGRA